MSKRERLQRVLDELCKSKSDFCRKVNISTSTCSVWIERDTFDPFKIAESFPQINTEWLIRGEGEMLKTDCKVDSKASKVKSKPNNLTVTALLSALELMEEKLQKKDEEIHTLTEQLKASNQTSDMPEQA